MIPFLRNYRICKNQLFYGKGKDRLWLSSAVTVEAITQNQQGHYGRWLTFQDVHCQHHNLIVDMADFQGTADKVFGQLLNAGMICSNSRKERNLLIQYFINSLPQRSLKVTDRQGWHEDVFVLASKTFGPSDVEIWNFAPSQHHMSGTLAEWQQNIAQYCVGNSRLILAVCAAFASSVLKILHQENGGFHVTGPSSCGKTTCLHVASSVFGTAVNTWRTTDNGLEGLALQHNDSLLILDELGQVNPHQIGDAVYMLANGASKGRADKQGLAQKIHTWRLLFLSSGETNLAQHMKLAGKNVHTGQELRCLTLNAVPSSSSFGLFETLHTFKNGNELALHLAEASRNIKGSAIEAFLTKVTKDVESLQKYHKDTLKLLKEKSLTQGAESQDFRVFERFACLGIVGEYARFVTGWPEGEALRGCLQGFQDWQEENEGLGNREKKHILAHVQLFFEQNAESCLYDLTKPPKTVINMVGYKDDNFYYITTQAFREVLCKAWNYKDVIAVLVKKGCLEKHKGRYTVLKKIQKKVVRVYRLDAASLFTAE